VAKNDYCISYVVEKVKHATFIYLQFSVCQFAQQKWKNKSSEKNVHFIHPLWSVAWLGYVPLEVVDSIQAQMTYKKIGICFFRTRSDFFLRKLCSLEEEKDLHLRTCPRRAAPGRAVRSGLPP